MAAHVIVDGYNVIRRTPRHADLERRSLELARRSLLDRLVAYRRAAGHRLTVVFDGVVAGDVAESRSRDRGVDVIFTARGTTADDVILRLAADASRGAVVVVTADLGLTRAVERRGAAVVSPADFEARLDLAAPGGRRRPGTGEAGTAPGLAPEALEEALEKDGEESEDATRRDKRGNPRKPPKAARRAAARLKRL